MTLCDVTERQQEIKTVSEGAAQFAILHTKTHPQIVTRSNHTKKKKKKS